MPIAQARYTLAPLQKPYATMSVVPVQQSRLTVYWYRYKIYTYLYSTATDIPSYMRILRPMDPPLPTLHSVHGLLDRTSSTVQSVHGVVARGSNQPCLFLGSLQIQNSKQTPGT